MTLTLPVAHAFKREGLDLRAALHELSPAMYRVVRRTGVADADADDALQRVFIKLAKHWEMLGKLPPNELRAYAITVAAHVAVDIAHERTRRGTLVALNEGENVETSGIKPDEAVEQKRQRELLDEILQTLPEERRIVFILYEIEELEMRQIAELLGLRMGTVASRLRKARAEFQAAAARMRAILERKAAWR